MASWPGGLPAINVANYLLTPKSQVIRSEMESGAPRVRRFSTARNDTIQCGCVMTRAQFYTFRTWFDDTIAGGADWFSIALQAGQNAGGAATTTETARFAGPWQAAAIDPNYLRVSFELEVRDA